ncbi:hypothetical protein QCA50_013787 [Cerrena zonata]|uniref:J domain-containing protein n=1 Tax=Cerrena zonata TaxID=2478898 RepID=A0AAW0FU60_9APHY
MGSGPRGSDYGPPQISETEKESLRRGVEQTLLPSVCEVKAERDARLARTDDEEEHQRIMEDYEGQMKSLKRLAEEMFKEAVDLEVKRLVEGGHGSPHTEGMITTPTSQSALYDEIQRERTRSGGTSDHPPTDRPTSGSTAPSRYSNADANDTPSDVGNSSNVNMNSNRQFKPQSISRATGKSLNSPTVSSPSPVPNRVNGAYPPPQSLADDDLDGFAEPYVGSHPSHPSISRRQSAASLSGSVRGTPYRHSPHPSADSAGPSRTAAYPQSSSPVSPRRNSGASLYKSGLTSTAPARGPLPGPSGWMYAAVPNSPQPQWSYDYAEGGSPSPISPPGRTDREQSDYQWSNSPRTRPEHQPQEGQRIPARHPSFGSETGLRRPESRISPRAIPTTSATPPDMYKQQQSSYTGGNNRRPESEERGVPIPVQGRMHAAPYGSPEHIRPSSTSLGSHRPIVSQRSFTTQADDYYPQASPSTSRGAFAPSSPVHVKRQNSSGSQRSARSVRSQSKSRPVDMYSYPEHYNAYSPQFADVPPSPAESYTDIFDEEDADFDVENLWIKQAAEEDRLRKAEEARRREMALKERERELEQLEEDLRKREEDFARREELKRREEELRQKERELRLREEAQRQEEEARALRLAEEQAAERKAKEQAEKERREALRMEAERRRLEEEEKARIREEEEEERRRVREEEEENARIRREEEENERIRREEEENERKRQEREREEKANERRQRKQQEKERKAKEKREREEKEQAERDRLKKEQEEREKQRRLERERKEKEEEERRERQRREEKEREEREIKEREEREVREREIREAKEREAMEAREARERRREAREKAEREAKEMEAEQARAAQEAREREREREEQEQQDKLSDESETEGANVESTSNGDWTPAEEAVFNKLEEDEKQKKAEQEEQDRLFAENLQKEEEALAAAERKAKEELEARRRDDVNNRQEYLNKMRQTEASRKRQDSTGNMSDTRRSPVTSTSASSSSHTATPWNIPRSNTSTHYAPADRTSSGSSFSNASGASLWSQNTTASGTSYSSTASAGFASSPKPTSSASAWGRTPHTSSTPHAPTPPHTTPATHPTSTPYSATPGFTNTTSEQVPYFDHETWQYMQDAEAARQAERFQSEMKKKEKERQAMESRSLAKDDIVRIFEDHERRWKVLPQADSLGWGSIPWPSLKTVRGVDDLNPTTINAYIRNDNWPSDKTLKERVREQIRRWHPDRFETNVLRKVREADRERVKLAAGVVARTLNDISKTIPSS